MGASQMAEKSPGTALQPDLAATSLNPKEPDKAPDREEHTRGLEGIDLVRIAFVALAAAAVWFHLWEPFPRLSVIGIAATLIGGYPIFKEAIENIVERRMTMESR